MVSTYEITVDGNKFVVEVGDLKSSPVQVVVNGEAKSVDFQQLEAVQAPASAPAPAARKPQPAPASAPTPAAAPAPAAGATVVKAPMPGKILSIRVKAGDKVSEGDTVCTLEAMKMEMPIGSTASGTVQGVHIKVGDSVAFDDPLVSIS
jgi:biotin carboxyl carrier protein